MPSHRGFILSMGLWLALCPALAGKAVAAEPIQFYRAESPQGRVSYFYPSFHIADARITRPPVAVLGAVKQLVIEADIGELQKHPETMVHYILSPAPLDLAGLFTPAELDTIRARAACNGIADHVERLRPFFIGMMVALPCPKPDGVLYELVLERAAQERGLKITALESADEEFAALFSLPDRAFIDEIRKYADDPQAGEHVVSRMVALYNDSNYDALYDLSLVDLPKNAADRRLFTDKVLLARNRAMVERMSAALAEGGALVMVGALHLPGKDGIVDLLRQRGFKITMVAASGADLR